MRKLCKLKGMPILRDPSAALMRLLSGSDRERGQSLTEYGLILAVLAAATVVVLGVLGSTVSAQLELVTAALRGEGDGSSFWGVRSVCHMARHRSAGHWGCWSIPAEDAARLAQPR